MRAFVAGNTYRRRTMLCQRSLRQNPSAWNQPRTALEDDGGGRCKADADKKQLWYPVPVLLGLSAVGTQASLIRNDGFTVPALLHDVAPGCASDTGAVPSVDTPAASTPIHRTRRAPPAMIVR